MTEKIKLRNQRLSEYSDTEFGQRIADMDINEVLAVMDELMTTLSVVNPRLYNAVMRKL